LVTFTAVTGWFQVADTLRHLVTGGTRANEELAWRHLQAMPESEEGMKKTTESMLRRACLEFLKLKGIVAWKNNVGAMYSTYKGKMRFMRFSEPGVPDIVGYLPDGTFLGVECKVGTRKETGAQREFREQAALAGCCCVVVRSIDDLQDALIKAEEEASRKRIDT